MKVTIQVPSRIHITLIGMGSWGYRVNGGIGFGIQDPNIVIEARPSANFYFEDCRDRPLTCEESIQLSEIVAQTVKRYDFSRAVEVKISGTAGAHSGFGSGTGIRLAVLESLFRINSMEIDNSELIKCSLRGGTSGIGVHTYFEGGLILDLGRKNMTNCHRPSSMYQYSVPPPLVLARYDMPDWPLGICIPKDITPLTRAQEISFFNKTCPISDSEVQKTLYHTVYGVYASAQEDDYSAYCESINRIQECSWKAAERQQHGVRLNVIASKLKEFGADAIGMSSLGPSLYFYHKELKGNLEEFAKAFPNCEIFEARPENKGRTVTYA